jgi:hypothetical protein
MEVVLGQGVGLGNDGNQVDTSSETLHNFNVERFESMTRDLRVSGKEEKDAKR